MPNEMLRDQGAGQTPQGEEEKVHTLEVDALNKTANTEDFSDFGDFDVSPEIAPVSTDFETSTGVGQETGQFEAPQVVEGAAFFDKFGMEEQDTVQRPGLEFVSNDFNKDNANVVKPVEISNTKIREKMEGLLAENISIIQNTNSKYIKASLLELIEEGLVTDDLTLQGQVLDLLENLEGRVDKLNRLVYAQQILREDIDELGRGYLYTKIDSNDAETFKKISDDLHYLGVNDYLLGNYDSPAELEQYIQEVLQYWESSGRKEISEEVNLYQEKFLELSNEFVDFNVFLTDIIEKYGEKAAHFQNMKEQLAVEFEKLTEAGLKASIEDYLLDIFQSKLDSVRLKAELFEQYEEQFPQYSEYLAQLKKQEESLTLEPLNIIGLQANQSPVKLYEEQLNLFHFYTHDESMLGAQYTQDALKNIAQLYEHIQHQLTMARLDSEDQDVLALQKRILNVALQSNYFQFGKVRVEKILSKVRDLDTDDELYVLEAYLDLLEKGLEPSAEAELVYEQVFGEAPWSIDDVRFFVESETGELLGNFDGESETSPDLGYMDEQLFVLIQHGVNLDVVKGVNNQTLADYLNLGRERIHYDFVTLKEFVSENQAIKSLFKSTGGIANFYVREFMVKERGGVEECLELLEKTASVLHALERSGQLESPDKSSLLQQQGESLLYVSRLNEGSGPDFDVLSFTKERLYDDLQLMGGTEWLALEDTTNEESVDTAPQGLLQKVKSAIGFSSQEIQEHNWSVYNSDNALENVWTGLTRVEDAGLKFLFDDLNLSVLELAYADNQPAHLVVQKALEDLNQMLVATSEKDFLNYQVLDFIDKLKDSVHVLESIYGQDKLEGEPLGLMTEYMTKIKPVFNRYNKYMPAQVGEYFQQFESMYTQVLDGKPFDGQGTFFTAQEVLGSYKMDQLELLYEAYSTLDKHPQVRKVIDEAKSFAVAVPRLRGYLLGYAKQRGENISENAVSNLFKEISKPEVLLNDILQFSSILERLPQIVLTEAEKKPLVLGSEHEKPMVLGEEHMKPVELTEDMRVMALDENDIIESYNPQERILTASDLIEHDAIQHEDDIVSFFDFDQQFQEAVADIERVGQYAIATRKYTRELRKDINQASRIIDFIKHNDNQLSLNEHDEKMLDRAAYVSMNYRSLDNGHINIGEVQEALAFVRGEDGRLSELVASVQESMEEVYNITDELKLVALGGDTGISEEALARLDISYRDKKVFMEAVTTFKAAQETLGPAVFQLMLPFIEAQRNFDNALHENGVSKVDLGAHFSTLQKGFGAMKQSLNETAQVFSTLIGLEDKISDASQNGNVVTIAYNGEKYQPNGLTYKQEGDQLIAMLATNNDRVVMELPLVKKLKDGTHQLQDIEVFKTAVVSRLQEAS